MARAKAASSKPRKTKARRRRNELAPNTAPGDPAERQNSTVIYEKQAGVKVTQDTALTLGSLWACVRYIAGSLACLPWNVFKRLDNGGRERQSKNPIDWLISCQANPETPAFQFRETLLGHAITWGNGYAEIERDGAGRPVWLWQLTPDRVEVKRTSGGRIVYDIRNPHEENTILDAADVFHVKGMGFDGLMGYSVVKMFARAIGLGIALEESAANFSQNDSTPGGVLKHPTRLTELARDNLRKSWQNRHGGVGRRRTVAILEENMDWKQTGLPPEDAQLIQQRQFTPSEMCRILGVPPHKAGDLTRSTFSNIEQQAIEAVTDCLMPWARRMESEADIKLFGIINRGTLYTKHNFNALLRGDTVARKDFYTAMLDRGVFSINDTLTFEDMNPIGSDGDKRFVPLNMQLLDQAGELGRAGDVRPAPTVDPGETPPSGATEKALPPATPAPAKPAPPLSILRPLAVDACARVLRREANCMKRFVEKTPDDDSVETFRAQHLAYMRDAVWPITLAITDNDESTASAVIAVFESEYRSHILAGIEQAKKGIGICIDIPAAAGHLADKLINLELRLRPKDEASNAAT